MKNKHSALYVLLVALSATGMFSHPALAQQTPSMPDVHDAHAFINGNENARSRQSNTGPRMLAYTWYSAIDSTLSPIDSSYFEYASNSTTQVHTLWHFRYQDGAWQRFDRYLYFYDTNGGNVRTDYQFWSKNGDSFQNFIRYNYTVNTNGAATDLLYQIWDNTSATYLNGISENYTLNGRDQRLTTLQRFWNKNLMAWENYLLVTNTYSSYGQMEEQILQYWKSSLSIWEYKKRYVWDFKNATGHQDADTIFEWENFHLSWVPDECNKYTLNAGHQPTYGIREKYLPGAVGWHAVSQTNFQYNPSGSLSSELLQNWDSSSMSFVNHSNTLHSYNKSGQQIVVSTLIWDGSAWVVGDYANRGMYYYESSLALPNPATNQLQIAVSPLPANDVIRLQAGQGVSWESFRLCIADMQGRIVNVPELSRSQSQICYSVAKLTPGMYVLFGSDETGASFSMKLPVMH